MNASTVGAFCPFDPMSPDIWRDPYPSYQALRQNRPIAWIEPDSRWHLLLAGGMTSARGFWMLTSFAEIAKALLDPGLGHRPADGGPDVPAVARSSAGGTLTAILDHWPLFLDAPAHAKVKKPLTRVLTGWPFETLRQRAHEVAARRIDELRAKPDFDLIRDFAYDIPMRVISRNIGVDEADHAMLTRWSYALYAALELGPDGEKLAEADRLIEEALDFFRTLLLARRIAPRDDLISSLLNPKPAETPLSDDEILANCILMLFAGHDTTLNLIGNAVLGLFEQPDAMAYCLGKGRVELTDLHEFLRFDSPQQLAFRYAVRDVEIGGQDIPAGDLICLALGSANRDSSVFDHPDRLDFQRLTRPHLAFGKGLHICPGSGFGLAMGKAALEALVPHLCHLEPRSWSWGSNAIMRGLSSFELSWKQR